MSDRDGAAASASTDDNWRAPPAGRKSTTPPPKALHEASFYSWFRKAIKQDSTVGWKDSWEDYPSVCLTTNFQLQEAQFDELRESLEPHANSHYLDRQGPRSPNGTLGAWIFDTFFQRQMFPLRNNCTIWVSVDLWPNDEGHVNLNLECDLVASALPAREDNSMQLFTATREVKMRPRCRKPYALECARVNVRVHKSGQGQDIAALKTLVAQTVAVFRPVYNKYLRDNGSTLFLPEP
eukprot:m.179933 g.179933  ORF g.179933 m.179933 type:complete len:237 (-) comp53434_c0_seq3:63-773(-)